uniref:IRG-type G domain-containing protein n=1 Tax=Dicentrarchus labrax TaxID=13489 RepID=A0A8P4GQ37_DICLA
MSHLDFDILMISSFGITMKKSHAEGAAKIQDYLEKEKNTPLNIAITGETGSGKSTFVNAFRGIDNIDKRAAPTGCVETTMEVTPYPHPKHPNVTVWDLPGVGTTKFPADKYLENVGFEKFDFFIIISDTRFRENDFYFVRSKIDNDLQAEGKSQREFDAERTLKLIKENCIQGLQNEGVLSPQVFLVSSFELHLYDFHLLHETLERELPAHKRNALLLAMPNINLEIINKKKEALQAKIKYYASVSALIASAPVAGLSFATDVTILAETIRMYQVTFGLDCESLENLARTARVPLNDLKEVMTSPLAAKEISKDLVIKLLCLSAGEAALMAAEEGSRFSPLIGFPLAMTFSFISTYRALSTFLNMLAEDAHRVFTKALGLNTSL